MLKKSRIIAVLSVCVMMFAIVEPAFAKNSRTCGEVGEEAKDWGIWGAIVGGVVVVGSISESLQCKSWGHFFSLSLRKNFTPNTHTSRGHILLMKIYVESYCYCMC